MRFVPPKSSEQLEIQAVHRIRQRLVSGRTRLVNQIRGLLAEHGVVVARDFSRIRRALRQVSDSSDKQLGDLFIELVCDVRDELMELDQRIATYTKRIRNLFQSNDMCIRIGRIEGIGPITATALEAAVGKRGERYLRTLMIHGARAVLRTAGRKGDTRSRWIEKMRDRRHPNVVAVALANKNARVVWAILSGRTVYQPAFSASEH